MPTYEYRCTACDKTFEAFQKISDPPIDKCPHCGGRAERLISAAPFSLKGGGWYKDGYSTPKPATGEKKEKKKNKTPDSKKS